MIQPGGLLWSRRINDIPANPARHQSGERFGRSSRWWRRSL